jgi:aerobic carbon-monoxide dehydrogenase medium subunit
VIPAAVDYFRPDSLADALAALATEDAKILAGGHSLIPLMKLRLARPSVLVDVGRVLPAGVQASADGAILIGALTTWRDVAIEPELSGCYSALRACAGSIGDVQVRNRGTIGGGLCHADPHADIHAPALALGATVVVASPDGERDEQLEGFVSGPFEPRIGTQDIVTWVCLPAQPPGARSAYEAVNDAASGYPVSGAAALVVVKDRQITGCRIGLTGVASVPFRPSEAEAAVLGWNASDGWKDLRARLRSVCDGVRVLADRSADADYRAAMARLVSARAVRRAYDEATSAGGAQ